MADTAAFFAKKKKGGKKKSFKAFNANKIDAKTISSTVHVDAPAISGTSAKALDLPVANMTLAESTNINNDQNQQSSDKTNEGWEDGSTPAARSNVVITNKNSVAELLDMNALEERRREQDDIAERMRLEETKAALAAAREGMEKEAQRLKEAQDQKKKVEETPTSNGDGKWVPVHLRKRPSAALGNSRLMMSKARGKSALPDTGDAMDFPDLASANAALEAQKKLEKERQEKERQRVAAAAAKPSGIKSWSTSRPSGSTPFVRKKIEVLPPEPAKAEPKSIEAKSEEVKKAPVVKPPTPAPAAPAAPPAVTPSPTVAPTLKKKKKKKKDLSTFKSSS